MAVPDEAAQGPATVFRSTQDIQDHSMRNLKTRHQSFGCCLNQALEGLPIPVGVVLVRRLPLHKLLSVPLGFLLELEVLDDMFRGLRDDPTHRVEPFAPGAP